MDILKVMNLNFNALEFAKNVRLEQTPDTINCPPRASETTRALAQPTLVEGSSREQGEASLNPKNLPKFL